MYMNSDGFWRPGEVAFGYLLDKSKSTYRMNPVDASAATFMKSIFSGSFSHLKLIVVVI